MNEIATSAAQVVCVLKLIGMRCEIRAGEVRDLLSFGLERPVRVVRSRDISVDVIHRQQIVRLRVVREVCDVQWGLIVQTVRGVRIERIRRRIRNWLSAVVA